MKLIEVYRTIVNHGMKMDPRGRDRVKKELLRAKKEYDKLDTSGKALYDKERLAHPYSDTRILYGNENTQVRTILTGIDMETPELLLADRLKEKGKKIDLVLSHHPEGTALAGFFNVMYMQIDILNRIGVPINIAESMMIERIKEVERKVSPVNHMRAVDAAELLGIAFMTCHTPADNCVASFLDNLMKKKRPETLDEVIDILKDIPEYKYSAVHNCPPSIIRGNASSKAGKIFVDMTGGTEGAKNIFGKLSQAGVSTLLCMHLSEEHFKKAKEEHLNVIIAGHIASDNVGLNLMFDEIESKSKLEILTCSGFRRFKRKK
ncbi:MAG: NGG1p interacting factor NIF3 [Candidatus Omnitrophica bacterium]|nr:NGG1p interacting factor NIF3 [Candidatus Omnitrophota bacterium]